MMRRERVLGEGPVNWFWDPLPEALVFYELYQRGKLTLEKAKEDILMTREHLAWLCLEYPQQRFIFRRQFKLRQRTFHVFEQLLKFGIDGEGPLPQGFRRVEMVN